MDVNIDIVFENKPSEDVPHIPLIYGGLRIEVNGCEVTRYCNQQELSKDVKEREQFESNWYDECGNIIPVEPYYFKGEFLSVNIGQISESFIEAVQSSPNSYKEIPVSFEKIDPIIVFSYISDEHLRIAFQNRTSKGHQTPIEVARGYAVSKVDLCNELINCYHTIFSYLDCRADMREYSNDERIKSGLRSELDELKDIKTKLM